MEKTWFEVAEGSIDSSQIHELRMDYKSKKSKIIQKDLGLNPLNVNAKIKARAEKRASIFFQEFYSPEEA